jgi:hypothetical protein
MKNTSFLNSNAKATVNTDIKVHPNPAPRKTELAITILENYMLSQKASIPKLTTLQTALLNAYSLEPTEQQMLELQNFFAQLFADKKIQQKETQKEEVAV